MYRKQQFDRLIQMVESQYQQKGLFPRKHQIIRNLLEKEADNFLRQLELNESTSLVQTKSERQKLFDANYKVN